MAVIAPPFLLSVFVCIRARDAERSHCDAWDREARLDPCLPDSREDYRIVKDVNPLPKAWWQDIDRDTAGECREPLCTFAG